MMRNSGSPARTRRRADARRAPADDAGRSGARISVRASLTSISLPLRLGRRAFSASADCEPVSGGGELALGGAGGRHALLEVWASVALPVFISDWVALKGLGRLDLRGLGLHDLALRLGDGGVRARNGGVVLRRAGSRACRATSRASTWPLATRVPSSTRISVMRRPSISGATSISSRGTSVPGHDGALDHLALARPDSPSRPGPERATAVACLGSRRAAGEAPRGSEGDREEPVHHASLLSSAASSA